MIHSVEKLLIEQHSLPGRKNRPRVPGIKKAGTLWRPDLPSAHCRERLFKLLVAKVRYTFFMVMVNPVLKERSKNMPFLFTAFFSAAGDALRPCLINVYFHWIK